MSVTVTEKRPGKWVVDIYFRWPDKSPYRERPVVDARSETQARRWGEQRESDIRAKGQDKAEEKKLQDRTPKVSKWFETFHAIKEAKGLVSVKDMRGRFTNWIEPIIGHKTMASVTPDDIRTIVRSLDDAIQAWLDADGQRGKGSISHSTAENIWGDLVHAFDEAIRSKNDALRVLDENPCQKVQGPETGDYRDGAILYSDEVTTLLRGVPVEGVAVPLYRRRVYAMAVYTMARRSELGALTTSDVDLVHRTIDISKQVGRTKKEETRKTKTKKNRTIDIEANVLPLVELLVAEAGAKPLLHMPPSEDSAELLRKDLWTVGCRRKELHEGDSTRSQIWFHHLRDTGLTHMAVRGDPPIAIQWRGGHTTFAMTQSYLDRGKVEGRRIGEPLPPLPAEVLVRLGTGLSV